MIASRSVTVGEIPGFTQKFKGIRAACLARRLSRLSAGLAPSDHCNASSPVWMRVCVVYNITLRPYAVVLGLILLIRGRVPGKAYT